MDGVELLPEQEGLPDARIYFVPLCLLLNVLIFSAYITFKDYGKYHKIQWCCFIFLSCQQTIENTFFDATVQTVNDWLVLPVILIYLGYQLFKK